MEQRKIRQLKSLSQVFLTTDWPVRKVVERLRNLGVQRVLEIGPGGGILTKALLEQPWEVVAIEKDRRFVENLQSLQKSQDASQIARFHIIHSDVLDFDLNAWLAESNLPTAVVGNIPYSISTPIVMWVLPHLHKLLGVEFLVQLEFAARLAGREGTKDYGSLSVFTQLRAEVELECKVDRTCFHPIPAVDSALVFLSPKKDLEDPYFLKRIETITRISFTQRRKKLRNAIKQFLPADAEGNCPISLDRRPDTLSPAEYVALSRYIIDCEIAANARQK